MLRKLAFRLLRFLRLVVLPIIPAGLVRWLARLLFSKSWARFEFAAEHPREVQQSILLGIARRCKNTEFGKEHDFASIKTIADFQKRVPVCNYDDLEKYIRKMTLGEPDILTAGKTTYFARTSGTTGPAKYIPVNELYLEEFRTARRVWYRQVAQVFPRMVRGTILTMHSPRIEGKTDGGIPYGSITIATGMVNAGQQSASDGALEAWEHFQQIPMSIFFIDDIDTKYYLLLRFALETRISLMAAINPSTLILMCRKLTDFAPDLINDCEQGMLKKELQIDPGMRSRFERRLKKNRKVAARMKSSLEKHKRVRPIDVWPKLCGCICWKGGSAPFYLRQFPEWFGDLPVMDYGFAATEGSFSIVMSAEGSKGVAAVTGHFLEFIPEECRNDAQPKVLTADELEVGKRYFILVTGSHGLYRYDMNDVVEVVDFYRKTPMIVFCHKGGNMISYTGEKISESQVVQAVTAAQEKSGVALAGFCVSVRLDSEHPRYVLAVEVSKDTADQDRDRLLREFELALQLCNVEYKHKRTSGRLGEPLLALVQAGAFEKYRQQQLSCGAADAHLKSPHLNGDPAMLETLGIVETIELASG